MIPFKTHDTLNHTAISHGFFSRLGGVSQGVYQGLNSGFGSGDPLENVIQNRALISKALGAKPEHLLSSYQIHSTKVMIANEPWDMHPDARPKADAIITNVAGIACTALAADCGPVLFADAQNGVVGAAHAGWRGALSGVTDATIEAMESIGARRDQISAVLGPCISGPNYEVGPDFRDQFSPADSVYFQEGEGDRSYFDLKAYIIARLKAAKIKSAIALADCTYAQPDTYFSYRFNTHQGVTDYGRNISAIMLKERDS